MSQWAWSLPWSAAPCTEASLVGVATASVGVAMGRGVAGTMCEGVVVVVVVVCFVLLGGNDSVHRLTLFSLALICVSGGWTMI